MVMETISDVATTAFSNIMYHYAQQSQARLRRFINDGDIRPINNAEDLMVDSIGHVEMREIYERNALSVPSNIEFLRRRLSKRDFEITLFIAKSDVENMLTDPTSDAIMECVAAQNRKFDDVVIDAMFDTVYTGRYGTTALTFAAEGGLTVDATGGLTYPKLLEGIKNFIDQEVGNDDGDLPMALSITGSEHSTLMQILQLTSGDYSAQMVVDAGRIQKAVGIDLVKYGATPTGPAEAQIPVVGGTRLGFLMAKGAMIVGIGREWTITVKDRPDYINVKQVQITGSLGAVRKDAMRIQKFNTV